MNAFLLIRVTAMSRQHPFNDLLPDQMDMLRRRALRLCHNTHRADDLVQATLLKAWTSRDSYKPETNLRAWLFTILRNTYFSELRKYHFEVEDVDGDYARELAEEPRQDHVLALKELIAAIARLPHVQRRPIVLMGAYGFSQQEVAVTCGCSLGTIKSRVGRGRAALHATLLQDPDGRTGPAALPRRSDRGGPRGSAIPCPASASAQSLGT